MDQDAGSVACVVPDDKDGERLDKALGALIPALSRSRLKRLILDGAVTGEVGAVRDPAAHVAAGQRYTVLLPRPEPIAAQPEAMALEVVFEDPLRRRPVGHRRRAPARHRAPDRQGHLGPCGRRQD